MSKEKYRVPGKIWGFCYVEVEIIEGPSKVLNIFCRLSWKLSGIRTRACALSVNRNP